MTDRVEKHQLIKNYNVAHTHILAISQPLPYCQHPLGARSHVQCLYSDVGRPATWRFNRRDSENNRGDGGKGADVVVSAMTAKDSYVASPGDTW